MTGANKITIGRIIVVPLFIGTVLYYKPGEEYYRFMALALFGFAAVSDFLDGHIARAWNEESRAGAILDSLADKFLLISAFLVLYKTGVHFEVIRFPIWLVVTVISRDVILLLGMLILHLLHKPVEIEPTAWGKATTFLQMACVIGMLGQWPFSQYFWYAAFAASIISGMDYVLKGLKILNT